MCAAATRAAWLLFLLMACAATLARLQYTYDDEGNRLTATRTPMPSGTPTGGTDEFQENGYDALNRLIACVIEHDNGSTTTTIRDDAWELDLLGNWNEGVMAATGATTVTIGHGVNFHNEIDTLSTQVGSGTPVETDFRYDAAGNLLYDGTYAYQFDAWNRLIQVVGPGACSAAGLRPAPDRKGLNSPERQGGSRGIPDIRAVRELSWLPARRSTTGTRSPQYAATLGR